MELNFRVYNSIFDDVKNSIFFIMRKIEDFHFIIKMNYKRVYDIFERNRNKCIY